MRVYLATSGEYSDYQICYVFAREEDARNYQLGDDVEEYEIQEGPVEVRTRHSLRWWFGRPDSETSSLYVSNPWESSDLRDAGEVPDVSHHWQSDLLIVEGWDLQRVRKVYSEQRAQYIAKQQNVS